MPRSLLASLLLIVAACANKEAPSSSAAPTDAPDASRSEAPAEDVLTPKGGECAPSETVLVKESRASLSGAMPAMETVVYDNGHWALSGPSASTGCLDDAQLADIKAAVDAAEVAAKPLEPGMARCMAMPIHAITVEAKGETATWKGPCGDHNPTESLSALQQKIAQLAAAEQ